jgi:FtsZ-interacting cell division protein ZipA
VRLFKIRARFNDSLIDGATHNAGDELELEAHRAHHFVHHGLAEWVDPSMKTAQNLVDQIRSLPEHDRVVAIADAISTPPAAPAAEEPEVHQVEEHAEDPHQVQEPAAAQTEAAPEAAQAEAAPEAPAQEAPAQPAKKKGPYSK